MREFNKTLPTPDFIRRFYDESSSSQLCKNCPNYAARWSCPPFNTKFDFSLYSQVKTILRRSEVSSDFLSSYSSARNNFDAYLLAIEKIYPHSFASFAGSCVSCPLPVCPRATNAECPRKPFLRPSLESLGFDVSKIAGDLFSIDIQWQSNTFSPKFLTLVAALWLK